MDQAVRELLKSTLTAGEAEEQRNLRQASAKYLGSLTLGTSSAETARRMVRERLRRRYAR